KGGKPVRREPTLGPAPGSAEAPDGGGAAAEPGDQGELEIESVSSSPEISDQASQPRRPAGPKPDRILSLYLLARDNHRITGAQLLEAAVKTGMDFGEMNIFHRITEGQSQPVFSMANGTKPGHFDRSAWHEFETSALVLFMTLPNPQSALDAWDSLLATARRMAEILNAELQDETHHLFTRRREAQIREEMREYDRRRITIRD
ncbi:MAG: cell division protein ZipA, partial [Xanthomonadales bacterium]|nr:cell division protein ZipA [Xanthomonadales bacterium]